MKRERNDSHCASRHDGHGERRIARNESAEQGDHQRVGHDHAGGEAAVDDGPVDDRVEVEQVAPADRYRQGNGDRQQEQRDRARGRSGSPKSSSGPTHNATAPTATRATAADNQRSWRRLTGSTSRR